MPIARMRLRQMTDGFFVRQRNPPSLRHRVLAWLDAPTVYTPRQKLALLAFFALLAVVRLPGAWAHGRFLGEEGTIFFAYAWHRPAADTLLRSFAGYLNLGANAATLAAARLVQAGALPLEAAPRLTMTLALAVQMLPAALIATADAPWLRRRGTMIAALMIPVVAPLSEEVFANTLHIQFHLALCAALILGFDVPRAPARQVACAAQLFAAPLCGPGAIVLLPFFVLRAAVERDRGRAVQAVVFALGAAIQLLLFFTPSPVRGQLLDPATLAAVLSVRLAALPLGGRWAAGAVGAGVHHSYVGGGAGWWAAAAAAVVGFAALVLLVLRRPRDAAAWLIGPALAIAAVSFGGGMIATDPSEWFNAGTAERYNFLPLVMLTLGLIVLAQRGGIAGRACGWLVALTLAWGAIGFAFPIRAIGRGADWPAEVAVWRRDHRHPLAAWPAAWTVDLSDADRPCPRQRAPQPSRTDPPYCESAWLQRVADAAAKVRQEAK